MLNVSRDISEISLSEVMFAGSSYFQLESFKVGLFNLQVWIVRTSTCTSRRHFFKLQPSLAAQVQWIIPSPNVTLNCDVALPSSLLSDSSH